MDQPNGADLLGKSGRCVLCGDRPSVWPWASTVATSTPAGMIMLTGSDSNSWKATAVVNSAQSFTAVSCLSLATCVVVANSISEYLAQG